MLFRQKAQDAEPAAGPTNDRHGGLGTRNAKGRGERGKGDAA
jgi:hypothetical protein